MYIAGICHNDTLNIGNQAVNDLYLNASIYFSQINYAAQVQWIKNITKIDTYLDDVLDLQVDNQGYLYLLTTVAGRQVFNQDTFVYHPYQKRAAMLFRYDLNNHTADHLLLKGSGHNVALKMLLLPDAEKLYLVGAYTDTLHFGNQYKVASNAQASGFLARVATTEKNMSVDWLHTIQSDSFSCITSIAPAKDGGIYLTGVAKSNYTFLDKNYTINPNSVNHFFAKLVGLQKDISYDGATYTALDTGALTYQWVDCNNNLQDVPGATNRTLTPNTPGSYAVRISNGACEVLSECLGITQIQEITLASAKLYPNPFGDYLNISVASISNTETLNLHVTDILGKTLLQTRGTITQLNNQLKEVSPYWPKNQMYQVQLQANGYHESVSFKIWKQ